MSSSQNTDGRLRIYRAVIVEGRDDADAVTRACEALIIPTHGYGISAETWQMIGKAYESRGIIILTDPDHAGGRIRRKLTERFPQAVQAYISREDADRDGDIGVENAAPDVIKHALERALRHADGADPAESSVTESGREVTLRDLTELGLSGADGAAEKRAAVCRRLGIGYCNAGAMLRRLRGYCIGYEELREAACGI